MKEMPTINEEKCEKCGLCVSVCACGALKLEGDTVKAVKVEDCGWCMMCELVCPSGAISCPFDVVIEKERA